VNIWKVIRGLNFRKLFRLAGISIRNPLLVYPTIKATKRTVVICEKLYKKAHHGHGPENAFRHALWNVLIAKDTLAITANKEKSVDWAAKFTDLHEELSPNNVLEKAMDLHNNQTGRQFFLKNPNASDDEIINSLISYASKAILITSENELINYPGQLVCIA